MKIGIIGGSGLDDPSLIQDCEEKEVETPFGNPSSSITCGSIEGVEVCILARHGKKHEIPPTQVNNRANIFALGKLGCTHIIATTAVGSLREEIGRGDFVVLDQFIDFTRHRKISFHEDFTEGIKHTPMADPFDKVLREKIIQGCQGQGIKYHPKGSVVTIEGPRFSTRAESQVYRMWGADVINMSIAPEAALANEAELPYAAIAMSTDYDCWKTDEEPVSWDAILEIFGENSDKMKKLLVEVIKNLDRNENLGESAIAEDPIVQDVPESLLSKSEIIKSKIRTIPNWPKEGIMFRDITTLLQDADGFRKTIEVLEERYKDKEIDYIAGIESRGFILASALALRLGKGMILIRKPGKLPAETISQEYELEYGTDAVEIHKDAIKPGEKVLLVDDLIATSGTCLAACNLIGKLGGKIEECAFIVELNDLGGRRKLEDKGYKMFSIINYAESG